jgi:hypothetical protein
MVGSVVLQVLGARSRWFVVRTADIPTAAGGHHQH